MPICLHGNLENDRPSKTQNKNEYLKRQMEDFKTPKTRPQDSETNSPSFDVYHIDQVISTLDGAIFPVVQLVLA